MIKINDVEVVVNKFPNNESRIEVDTINPLLNETTLNIHFKWFNDEDLISLYFVLSHIKFNNALAKLNLYIEYMPYSRMDRDQNGNCYTLLHITKLINSTLGANDNVYIAEPHSDVTLELISNSHRIKVIPSLMNKILEEHAEIDMICYPDKGAKERFQDDTVCLPVVFCNKVRDFATGEIKGLELDGNTDVSGKNILILDDLCSKGGTFYHTANKLHENGAKDIFLGVCHMEKSVQDGHIFSCGDYTDTPIKHIYCTDSMIKNPHLFSGSNITTYSMEHFLEKGKFTENV